MSNENQTETENQEYQEFLEYQKFKKLKAEKANEEGGEDEEENDINIDEDIYIVDEDSELPSFTYQENYPKIPMA